jgi:hypothetical protein
MFAVTITSVRFGYAYEAAGTSRTDGDLGQEAYVHGTWAMYI